MQIAAAAAKIAEIAYKPLSDLLPPSELSDLKTDKGLVGKILERQIGLTFSNSQLDFEDGDLKTNKVTSKGLPLETMFICQIHRIFDTLIVPTPYESSYLYQKITRFLYVRVCKIGPQYSWYFHRPILVDLTTQAYKTIGQQLRHDYYEICRQVRRHIEDGSDHLLHTSSGFYLQIRTKDAKPYRPIYSHHYGRAISTKNFAFYFKKELLLDLIRMSPDVGRQDSSY